MSVDELGFEVVGQASPKVDELGFEVVQPTAPAPSPSAALADTAPLTAQALGATVQPDQQRIANAMAAARAGGGGFISPPVGDEALQNKTMREMLPTVAGLAVPPIGGAGVLGLAATGAASGLASGLANQALGGGSGTLAERAGQVAKETGIGGVSGGALGTAGKTLSWLGQKAIETPVISEITKKFLPSQIGAYLFKPAQESLEAAAARRGRDVIEAATGERPAMGIGEAIGSPDIVDSLKVVPPKAELPPEAVDALKKNVLFSVSKLGGIGLTADEIAADALSTLRSHVGDVSSKTVKATEDLAATYASKLENATKEVQAKAASLFRDTGASPLTLGERLRDKAQAALQKTKDYWNELYDAVRDNPLFKKPVAVDNGELSKFSEDVLGSTVQTKAGGSNIRAFETGMVDEFGPVTQDVPNEVGTKAILSALPEGTAKYLQIIGDMSGTPQSIETLKNLRTQVADSISNQDVLPGLGAGRKKQLVGILSRMIEDGLNKLPDSTLKDSFKAANTAYATSVDRFQGSLASGILKDVGKEGGKSPEAILAQFTGPSGGTNLKIVRDLLGGSASEGDAIIREHVLNEVGKSAADGFGNYSISKLRSGIEKLAPEVRDVVMSDTKGLDALAQREARIAGLPDPKKFSESLTIDKATLTDALGAGSAKDVQDALSGAIKAKAAQDKVFRNQILREIGEGSADTLSKNPGKFIDGILGGNFSPEHVSGAMNIISKESPVVAEQVQFRFLEKLIEKASTKEGIDAAKLSKSIAPAGPTTSGGADAKIAEAILGKSQRESVQRLADAFGAIDKAGNVRIGQNSTFLEALARGGGMVAGSALNLPKIGPIGAANTLGWLARKSRETRYITAAAMLTTPELREIASRPISQITRDNIRDVLSKAAQLSAQGASEAVLGDLSESAVRSGK